MLLWPARVVTAQATYDPAHFRWDAPGPAELLDKAGVVIETLADPSVKLVAEGAETGQQQITQRWQVESSQGRWLVELTRGCGCGGTRTTAAVLEELAW